MTGREGVNRIQRDQLLAVVRAFPGLTADQLVGLEGSAYARSRLPEVLRALRECCQVRVVDGRYWAA